MMCRMIDEWVPSTQAQSNCSVVARPARISASSFNDWDHARDEDLAVLGEKVGVFLRAEVVMFRIDP